MVGRLRSEDWRMAANYDDEWWARVYDSIYRATRQQEHEFYVQQAGTMPEPVLEIACGTGMVFLDLIRAGVDAYGFDISLPMLDALKRKASDGQRDEILRRVSRQDMADFSYPSMEFGTVLIPSGSFLFLLTQAEQIACLANIRRHLRSGGTLVLNFPVPSYQHLSNKALGPQTLVTVGDFEDALNGSTVHLACKTTAELVPQLQHMTWRFSQGSAAHEAAMCCRWVFPEEFKLLLRLAGFSSREVFGGFERNAPLETGDEAAWVASAERPAAC
jgi:SAM-dependent methyltransferase